MDEDGGHEDEAGCGVEVRVPLAESLEVVVHNAGDADLGDVDVILADQLQQQLERTVEDRGSHFVRHLWFTGLLAPRAWSCHRRCRGAPRTVFQRGAAERRGRGEVARSAAWSTDQSSGDISSGRSP